MCSDHTENAHGTKLQNFFAEGNFLVINDGQKHIEWVESRHSVIDLCLASKRIVELEAILQVDFAVEFFTGARIRGRHPVLVTF